MKHSKWLAKLGAVGYDTLILINRAINYLMGILGKSPITMSKKIKNSVKSAVKFINNFEATAAEIAIENNYDYVVCGHNHQPVIREIEIKNGNVIYLNSGDWFENLTALEYNKGSWELYHYYEDSTISHKKDSPYNIDDDLPEDAELFNELLQEFQLKNK